MADGSGGGVTDGDGTDGGGTVMPIFRHLDDPDVPWRQVRSVRSADGTTASVWEKWLALSAAPRYLAVYARWDPGMVVRRHGRYSPYVLFVIEGELWCDDRFCPAGTHVELPRGAALGPFVAGPRGVILFEVMMGDPRTWGVDPDAYRATLDRLGAKPLPDPAIDLPEWLVDLRGRWVVDGEELEVSPSSDLPPT